jgi:hypothetical protein
MTYKMIIAASAGALVSSGNLHDWIVIGGVSLVSLTASFGAVVGLAVMGGLWLVIPLLALGLIPVYVVASMGGSERPHSRSLLGELVWQRRPLILTPPRSRRRLRGKSVSSAC